MGISKNVTSGHFTLVKIGPDIVRGSLLAEGFDDYVEFDWEVPFRPTSLAASVLSIVILTSCQSEKEAAEILCSPEEHCPRFGGEQPSVCAGYAWLTDKVTNAEARNMGGA